jgi:hypothetical protein
MPRNSTVGISFRFSSGVLVFVRVMIIGWGSAACAESDHHLLRARFDQLVLPAVEAAVRQPGTNLGGTIAWGPAYQLAALVEMFDATRESKHAKLIVELGDWIGAARDDRHSFRDELRDRVVPAWSSTNYSAGKRYAWAVHTGMITTPMARFAAVVRSDPALRERWGSDADRLLKVAEQAVGLHDEEYREGPGPDEGHVYCPYLKKHLPLNMQNALAQAWLAIDDATQTQKHQKRILRLGQFLKNRLRATEDGAYVWAYWPPLEGEADSFEDISHAAINVNFMVRCFEHDIVFNHEDLARLEKTLLNRVLVADGRISDTVGGGGKFNTYRSDVLRWAPLGRHSSAVRERLMRLSGSPEFGRDITSLPLALACLLPPAGADKSSGSLPGNSK